MVVAVRSRFLQVEPGHIVSVAGINYRITHILSINNVLCQNLETRESKQFQVYELAPVVQPKPGEPIAEGVDLESIADEGWKEAQRRFLLIRPLIEERFPTRALAEAIAQHADVHVATIYEWRKLYLNAGHVSALMPGKRGRPKGTKRLAPELEAIILKAVETKYLTKQRHSPQDVIEEVEVLCRTAGLPVPHPNTIRNRIREIPEATQLRRRGRKDKARNLYEPIIDEFPGATVPLAVVQIDHTESDIIVVEEETRRPMGRPWLTLAICVCTRMVVGLYLSMEKPSAVAAGMCLAHSILPKNDYLALLDVPGDWPAWGVMNAVHMDNAREFRGAMLKRASIEHGMTLELRPVKKAHYGGHIERLMGTAAGELKRVPGATFSKPEERRGYDSEAEAALTLKELEQHLVDFLVNKYHQRVHGGLNMPPIRRWQIGLLGDSTTAGIGLPQLPADPFRIYLDFLPFLERTVQPYGILIDHVYYYHEVLNRWINAKDPDNSKEKRLFIVRRDPRDISRIYFFDPEAQLYYEIPYRNTSLPAVSLWEFREAHRQLVQEGRAAVDEDIIFAAVLRGRERITEAIEKTKAARKRAHRTKMAQEAANHPAPLPGALPPPARPQPASDDLDDLFAKPIEPFEDRCV